jgi:hypothetical protein
MICFYSWSPIQKNIDFGVFFTPRVTQGGDFRRFTIFFNRIKISKSDIFFLTSIHLLIAICLRAAKSTLVYGCEVYNIDSALVKMEENAQFFPEKLPNFFWYSTLNFQQNSLKIRTMRSLKINFRFMTVSVCSEKKFSVWTTLMLYPLVLKACDVDLVHDVFCGASFVLSRGLNSRWPK